MAGDGPGEQVAARSFSKPTDFEKKAIGAKADAWGCSSVGRAPALQAGGQEFEPLHLHRNYVPKKEGESLRLYFDKFIPQQFNQNG